MSWWSSDDPRRRIALIAALLAGTALVGLGAGSLLGMAGGGGATTEATSSDKPSPSPSSPSATASPTPRASSEIEHGATSDIGYFVGARDESDGTHVTFDRVLLMVGKDARDYAKTYHKKRPPHDGFLLVNDNPLTRDLVLAPDVRVLGSQQLAGSPTLTPVPLQTLIDEVASDGSDLLLDLTYDDLGYVTKVREHVQG